jgi:hypothetical protein
MQINTGSTPSARSALFLIADAILIAFASVLLLVWVDFTITLGDIVGTPIATAEGTIKLEHAGNLALDLYAAVQIVLAALLMKSAFLKTRWHMALRAVGALFAGIALSCLLVFLAHLTGVWPSPLEAMERVLRAWILKVA